MIDHRAPHLEDNPRPLRVALAHDWLVGYRGGEMVLDAIAQLLHAQNHSITRIYTMFDNATDMTPTLYALPRTASSLNRYPDRLRRWLLPRYPRAIQQLSQQLAQDHANEPIDLLISTSSAAVKSIKPPSGVPHICYCHTPARYLWSQTEHYTTPDLIGRLRAFGLARFAPKLRRWDQRTASHTTEFIANSTHTAQEIDRCYQRCSTVIHPPVRTDFFTPDPSVKREDHLLIVSALEPYKRVELAIQAAKLAHRPLIIVGAGSQERVLKRLAHNSSTTRFVGKVSNQELRHHYRRAHAFLFPQIEDFGITAVEAQACGCPVVAQSAGGALDTVINNKTGALFDQPTPQALADAISRCPSDEHTAPRCVSNAAQFSHEHFKSRLAELLSPLTHQGG